MYFLGTIFLGWIILKTILHLFCLVFDLNVDSVYFIINWYVIIGYFVMYFYDIKSPLVLHSKTIMYDLKTISLKRFFHDIYYAVWWPYYIWTNLNKNNIK